MNMERIGVDKYMICIVGAALGPFASWHTIYIDRLYPSVAVRNFLNRIGDLIQEFIETFAHIAAAVIRTVLRDSSSLVQTAVNSSFPAVGAAPVIHHAGKNMMVKTHSQRRPGVVKPPKASVLETGAKGDDDEDEDGAITFEIHDNEESLPETK